MPVSGSILAVFTDRLNGATLHRLAALGNLIVVLGLLENKGISLVIRTGEIVRRSFAAQVAINALAIHVKFSGDVLGVSVFAIGHESVG
jgi:hypothetical protein